MKYKLYQINMDRDSQRHCFRSLERIHGKVDCSSYDFIYSGELPDNKNGLEALFRIFNVDKPDDFKGRSMSVSDIVVISGSETLQAGAYFCDMIGFQPVDFREDLASAQPQPSDDMLTVVLVQPGKKAEIAKIGRKLENLQGAVGGTIETYSVFSEPVTIVCNDDGKIIGLPLNRAVYDEDSGEVLDIIAGTFFVCGIGSSDFTSLTPAQQEKYLKLFRFPESFAIDRNTGAITVISLQTPEEEA